MPKDIKMNNSRWIRWIIPFMVTCCLGSCQQKGKLLKEGDWRGVFSLAENEIPFHDDRFS